MALYYLIGFFGLCILAIAIGIFFAKPIYSKFEFWFIKLASAILSTFATTMITLAIVGGIKFYYKIVYDFKYNIVSLTNQNTIHGYFSLGTGYIGTTEYYFMYKNDDKGLIREKLQSNISYIVETNDIQPSVYYCKDRCSNKYYYKIYCPIGTVLLDYKIET